MPRQSFDSAWRFHLCDSRNLNEWPQALAPHFDDTAWRLLDLPHDWSIEQPRSPDHPSGSAGGFFVGGTGWYRKTFEAPADWAGKRVRLEFEGAYQNAELWLNGRFLDEHPYGYTSFIVDLTPLLKSGARNTLVVRLDTSSAPHTRWYAGSGLYRHVWLHVTDPVHLEPWGIAIQTPSVTDAAALVAVTAEIANTTAAARPVSIQWRVLDPDGREAARAETRASTEPESVTRAAQTLQVPRPRRWSVDQPVLYRLETRLLGDAGEQDQIEIPFGIRTFRFTPAEGFVLNDQPLLLKGGCVHHDCGPLGAQSLDRAEERKVEVLKASGFNAVRCAHNPPAPAFLDACDRLGMLVIDEAFDVWQMEKMPFDYHRHFNTWWQRDLDSMLRRDRNHPSIILWSIGNELIERGFPEGARIARKLADHVRSVDPTRPVTAGICDLWGAGPWRQLADLFAALDVCGYNYQVAEYEPDHAAHPERVILATESFPNRAFDYWKAVEKLPYVAGDFVWTALDYLGESGIGRTFEEGKSTGHMPGWPWHQANCGDLDLCGWKRPQSHYRDVLWGIAPKPYIAVHPPLPDGYKLAVSGWGWHDCQPSWTWPEAAGKTLRVDVYFNCDEVELLLNGRSLGRQPATVEARHLATFQVPYAPGELKAVAITHGRAVAESVLRTAGPAERLVLEADRATLKAHPNDLAYVTVSAVDANGILVPTAAHMVHFTLRGPAALAAVASADPRNTEPYRGNVHSLWRGRALAVVRPAGAAGQAILEAHADGLEGADITITCKT
jgi:beta-galactosidase